MGHRFTTVWEDGITEDTEGGVVCMFSPFETGTCYDQRQHKKVRTEFKYWPTHHTGTGAIDLDLLEIYLRDMDEILPFMRDLTAQDLHENGYKTDVNAKYWLELWKMDLLRSVTEYDHKLPLYIQARECGFSPIIAALIGERGYSIANNRYVPRGHQTIPVCDQIVKWFDQAYIERVLDETSCPIVAEMGGGKYGIHSAVLKSPYALDLRNLVAMNKFGSVFERLNMERKMLCRNPDVNDFIQLEKRVGLVGEENVVKRARA